MRHHHTQFGGKFVMMTTRTCQPAEQLLSLMTGAWHTQAIAVAANMGLADHLAQNVSTKELAERLDADHQALRRLLRYLASIGILRTSGSATSSPHRIHHSRWDPPHRTDSAGWLVAKPPRARIGRRRRPCHHRGQGTNGGAALARTHCQRSSPSWPPPS